MTQKVRTRYHDGLLPEEWNAQLAAAVQSGIKKGLVCKIGSAANRVTIEAGELLTAAGETITENADLADYFAPATGNEISPNAALGNRIDLIVAEFQYAESAPPPDAAYFIIEGTPDVFNPEIPTYNSFQTPIALGLCLAGTATYSVLVPWPRTYRLNHTYDNATGEWKVTHGLGLTVRMMLISKTFEAGDYSWERGLRIDYIAAGTKADGAVIAETDWVAELVITEDGLTALNNLVHDGLSDLVTPASAAPVTTAIPGVTLSLPFGSDADGNYNVLFDPSLGQIGAIRFEGGTWAYLEHGRATYVLLEGTTDAPTRGCIATIVEASLSAAPQTRAYTFVFGSDSSGHDPRYQRLSKSASDTPLVGGLLNRTNANRIGAAISGSRGGIVPISVGDDADSGNISTISGLDVTIFATVFVRDALNSSSATSPGQMMKAPETTLALRDSDTNDVVIDEDGRMVLLASGASPANNLALYGFITSGGEVTQIIDRRVFVGQTGHLSRRRRARKGAQEYLPTDEAFTGFQDDSTAVFHLDISSDDAPQVDVSAELWCDLVSNTMPNDTTLIVTRTNFSIDDLIAIEGSTEVHRITNVVTNTLTITPAHAAWAAVVSGDLVYKIHLIDGASDWRRRWVRIQGVVNKSAMGADVPIVSNWIPGLNHSTIQMRHFSIDGPDAQEYRHMFAFFYTGEGADLPFIPFGPAVTLAFRTSSGSLDIWRLDIAADPASGALVMRAGPYPSSTNVADAPTSVTSVNCFIDAGVKRG